MGQPVTHWQIITREPDRVASFYKSMFGWDISTNNALGYRMVDTASDRGIDGGIWPAPPEANDFVQLFIEVDDVGAAVQRVVELGGRIIVPAQKLPDGDELAIMQDPAGISFGLKRNLSE